MAKESEESDKPPTRRGTRFVPLEDAPRPGMSARTREVVALGLCGASLYAMLGLATFRLRALDGPIPAAGMENLGGVVGYYLASGCTRALGYASWVLFFLLLAAGLALFLGRKLERVSLKALGAVVFAAMLAILFAGKDGLAGTSELTPYGAGGRFGAVLSPQLDAAFGGSGRLLLVGFGSLVSLLLATEWMFSDLLLRLVGAAEQAWRRWRGGAEAVPAFAGAEVTAVDGPAAPRRRRPRRPAAEAAADAELDPAADDDGDVAVPEQEAAAEAGAVVAPPGRRSRRRRDPVEVEDDDDELDGDDVASPPRKAGSRSAAAASSAAADQPESVVPSSSGPSSSGPTVPAGAEPAAPVLPTVLLRTPAKPAPKPKPKPKPKKPGQSTLPFDEAYPFPPVELFQEATHTDLGATAEVLARGGQAIVQKLANFGVESSIEAASVGPAVTQYELRVADKVRVSKVVTFESDLAAALKAVSVRVVAPIPGKDTIGIEVPNPTRQKVFMRDLLDQFGRAEDLAIPLFLGKDVAGSPIVEDLARMPHLLIAGTTGSGKSVCINTILLSILMSRTPQQVKLILVDPKMVELQAYKRVPHLCCEVVTNMKKAPGVLQWAVDEMENRYALLSAAGVNHIRNYNRLGQQELEKRMQRQVDADRLQLSYIVIVIDEFADLMNVAQNEVEELIQRLAQKSRAVGMHVILATQRPSSEVITGIIKANLPCQISFKVNRKIDSRVILDANGAEKLLGHGDMLYMPPGGGALLRAQGTFVADEEMQAVVRHLEEHGQQPEFNPDLVQTQSSSRPSMAERDDLYREAVEIVLGQQRGSATLLQRALSVGYTRATRLLELMEADGLVGAFVGSKSRDVLLTLEEWKQREASMAEAMAEIEAAGEAEDSAEEADADQAGAEEDAEAAAADGEAQAAGLDEGGDLVPDGPR